MSLNNTPSAERLHIGIFGKRNAGKSSVINALTGQNLAIVSDIKGTTTDPVLKSMELLPLGPVVIIDTPGLDDDADILGELRIQKAYQMLNKTDIAILVIDGTVGMTEEDKKILTRIQDKKIPYIVVLNKADLAVSKVCPGNQSDSDVCKPLDSMTTQIARSCQIAKEHILWVSAQDHSNIQELKELIGKLIPSSDNDRYIVRDLIRPMDLIVLVVPIDSAAPKGRLILPQQQTIRDILESGAVSIVVRETEAGFVSIIAGKLKGKKYNVNQEWMMTIAYYRGVLEEYENHPIIKKLIEKSCDCDYIIAPIADNRMFQIINSFIMGEITDEQCKHCLAATNLGYQYVFKSDKAIKSLKMLERCYISEKEKEYYKKMRNSDAKLGDDKVKLARIKYRGKGRYIDEILK